MSDVNSIFKLIRFTLQLTGFELTEVYEKFEFNIFITNMYKWPAEHLKSRCGDSFAIDGQLLKASYNGVRIHCWSSGDHWLVSQSHTSTDHDWRYEGDGLESFCEMLNKVLEVEHRV